jgi:hypothetical protein
MNVHILCIVDWIIPITNNWINKNNMFSHELQYLILTINNKNDSWINLVYIHVYKKFVCGKLDLNLIWK